MAVRSRRFPAWRFYFVLFIFLSLVVSSALSQCHDGTYEHEEKTCCLCGIGYHLERHCTSVSTDRQCTPCQEGLTFMIRANNLMTCEPCTSCSHENANLEVAEPCLPSSDTKCRCKPDHYCDYWTNPKSCGLCQPCTKCGPEGVKTECSDSGDRVCNDKREGTDEGTNHGVAIGITLALIAVVAVAAAVYWFMRKKKLGSATMTHPSGEDPAVKDVVYVPVPDVDLQPHLPAIAEVIGWNDMKNAAMRGSITETSIGNCSLNHPDDHYEQTLELLGLFVQHHGSEAPNKLMQILLAMKRKAKAEKLKDMLSAA